MSTHFFRRSKKNNFTIVSNTPLRDTRLSWKAKGILAFLLHLPDDWNINQTHLCEQAKDGWESLSNGLKELTTFGYLRRTTKRNTEGKILGIEWTIFEEGEAFLQGNSNNDYHEGGFPDTEKPDTGNPDTAKPIMGKPGLLRTKDTNLSKDSTKESNISSSQVKPAPVASADAERLAEELHLSIQKVKPDVKPPNLKTWAKEIDLMLRIDKRTPDQIRRIIAWLPTDPFWQVNILSAKKLREKFDQLELKANQNTRTKGYEGNRGNSDEPTGNFKPQYKFTVGEES